MEAINQESEINLEYVLTYRDFVAGHKLTARRSVFLFVLHFVTRFVAPMIVLVLLLIAVINIASGHADLVPAMLPLIFLFSLLPLIIWASWWFSFAQIKNKAKTDPVMTFRADANEFCRQTLGMGEIRWLWSATNRIAKNRKIVLISPRKGAYLFIPRRAVTDAQLNTLERYLAAAKGLS